ncbi:cytochrome c [Alkalihalobacillus sp. AL-G]|uniref:c-type cytochrome n=1 Tax=Alkalihalobacillus sp. AL-G TaxID=2926399 RepID=UPI00272CC66E|nr:cytochrome c [Alkalihalobacillus sp. AL-G]WLD94059.1 cytochrome c [Alkalihalobacillus sp. AL-G]
MKRIFTLLVLLGLSVGLAACGGGNEGGSDSTGNGSTTEVDVDAAKASFQQSCATCHGKNLRGNGNAPALNNIGKDHSKEEILAQIKNGGGQMPAGLIEGEEAENVAAWLATMK